MFANLKFGESNFLRFSSGLDYDTATVNFKATHKTDGDTEALGELFKVTSKLSTIGLRLGTSFAPYFLDPLGGYFSFNAVVPLSASGPQQSSH